MTKLLVEKVYIAPERITGGESNCCSETAWLRRACHDDKLFSFGDTDTATKLADSIAIEGEIRAGKGLRIADG